MNAFKVICNHNSFFSVQQMNLIEQRELNDHMNVPSVLSEYLVTRSLIILVPEAVKSIQNSAQNSNHGKS